MLTDLDLMTLHIRALFLTDDQDRLLSTNEPDPPSPPPRLYLGRTTAGNAWRFPHDLPHDIARDLASLLRAEPTATDLTQPPRCLEAMRTLLTRHAPITEVSMGPAWHFPEHIPPPRHDIIHITPENDTVVRDIFPTLANDLPDCQPCLAILHEDRLASICFSARNTPEAAEAGLETLEPFRGRGFATAVVAAWARAVRQDGRIPLYSTSWDNLASRAVARKLGLVLYGTDLTID
jgi:RimJ/RimL family protein N-acetyltransferase